MRKGAARSALAVVIGATLWAQAQPVARLRGRVFERGSIVPLAGAQVQSAAASAVTDDKGGFELELPSGDVELLVTAEGHEPLRVRRQVRAGETAVVEYRLTPEPARRRRYQTVVRSETRHLGEHFSLREDELHQVAGGLGDPFRVVGMLPGVATPVPVLPVYVIRGATPGMNGFFLDGMRVPQLFHFLVGGGVVHGRLIERLDFYPGVYDVSFGRYAGGVVDAETRPARADGQHGEVELRLYDVSTLGEAKLPAGIGLTVSGHYGYPGPIIRAFEPGVDVQYWDYQARLDWKGLTLEALGSFDSIVIARDEFRRGILRRVPDEFRLSFHRLQLRSRSAHRQLDAEAGVVGGIDQMSIFGGQGVQKLSLAGRVKARLRMRLLRLEAGIDAELSRFVPANFSPGVSGGAPDQLADLGDSRTGVVAGAYLEATVALLGRRLETTLGARADVYHTGAVTLLGVDPRLSFRARLLPELAITGGFGLYQQPPSFPVPLPGVDTFALQLGLQRAWQSAAGLEARLPGELSFSLTGFYQRYFNINDVTIDLSPALCTSAPPESLSGLPAQVTRQVNGDSFGMELLLRKQAGRLSGWIAYTLSRSERIYSCGLRPSDFDQTHVLNLVAQLRLPANWMLGARLYFSTGRPVTILEPPDGASTLRNNRRLPNYFELDLRLDREWIFQRWALAAFVEVLNTTYSTVALGLKYPVVDGVTRFDQPQLNGFRWILPSLGVRGRF